MPLNSNDPLSAIRIPGTEEHFLDPLGSKERGMAKPSALLGHKHPYNGSHPCVNM